jgi:ABC-type nitrate/sulfonate/bicarbonate transport system substrate-binding protein
MMAKFQVAPHMRLQEWIAEEKGYFKDEGLDYEFLETFDQSPSDNPHDYPDKFGAFQTFEAGRKSDVSCACHWTVNVAAANGHGRLYADAYSVSPCAIWVAPDSNIKKPEDLADVPIAVGYQSGSHYSTIQALEQFLKPDQIKLDFSSGLVFKRMELLIDGKIEAASLFSGAYYLVEQLGFKKITETTFMMAQMINGEPDEQDVKKYFAALKRAQQDLDLRPELYTKYYYREMPQRFHEQMDVRRWGPGERIVFEPYSREIFETSYDWIAEREIFDKDGMGVRDYDKATVSLDAAE